MRAKVRRERGEGGENVGGGGRKVVVELRTNPPYSHTYA